MPYPANREQGMIFLEIGTFQNPVMLFREFIPALPGRQQERQAGKEGVISQLTRERRAAILGGGGKKMARKREGMRFHPDHMGIPQERQAFFTADLHLGHENIITHCDRPFADTDEMTETILANWNAVVPENGIVFVIGDMFWKRGHMSMYEDFMRRANGEVHLILGSHDVLSPEDYEKLGIASISHILKVRSRKHGASIFLQHCPCLEWDGYWRGVWHLHGHTHGNLRHPSVRAIDVGVDCTDFSPLPLDRVCALLEAPAAEEMRILAERQRHDPLGSLSEENGCSISPRG